MPDDWDTVSRVLLVASGPRYTIVGCALCHFVRERHLVDIQIKRFDVRKVNCRATGDTSHLCSFNGNQCC